MSSERFACRENGRTCSPSSLGRLGLPSCIFLLVIIGCSRGVNDHPDHDHGGHLIDLPGHEQMQLELSADEQRRQLVVYVLESGTHTPYPVASKKLDITFSVSG